MSKSSGKTRTTPTFTELERRKQIIHAAIETIAELGYAAASYAQIARRAGLSSTGLISYHFENKAELIDQVVAAVVSDGQAYMVPRIEVAAPGRERVRAYIASNLEFIAAHSAHIRAVAEILNALPPGETGPYAPRHARGLAQLEGYLREGQRAGEFRRFSVAVMAMSIRAAIDAVAYQLADEPGLDLGACRRELVTLFDEATRAHAAGNTACAVSRPRPKRR